jgi:diacylglycerol O-acyltransferase / wax synthase
LVEGTRSLGARLVVPAPRLSIEGTIGPHRRWAVGRCRITDLQHVRHAFGGSINDVVLAVITGAFRELLLARGDVIDETSIIRTLVPVSIRDVDDHAPNNQVSLMIAELPVGVADAVDRLESLTTQMAQLKGSHQVDAGKVIISSVDHVPPALFALGARAVINIAHRVPQRSVNTVTTNVRGPQFALYALGREMTEYLPFVPLSEGMQIGVAIVSYNGRVAFGITGDYDSAPDTPQMAHYIESEVERLRRQARRVERTKAAQDHG